MANRSVKVTLQANVADFRAQMGQAKTSLDELVKAGDKTGKVAETGLGRMTQSMQLQREHWTQAGTAMTAFGVATTGAFAMSAKAAVDWESSFAGVLKTVDGTPEQLAAIEEGLRGMARELPASHAEIAAVAEAAGQLGIQTEHVLGFTRTMIDLGEATNMSADEAATSLARFVNIMGSSQSEFSNIGSAVVELGNNFATTESEIVAMSMRLAGAGAQIGLSEAEVLALATAMSSLGIEAEAGGTAMSQTMIQMRNAVDEGGESLEAFATAAGMSSEAFSQLFRESPAEAIQAVVNGLGEMEAQGINTSSVLSDMGATGLRQSDALRRLSGDATILGDAFRMATQAYGENSALADEAAQRYDTVASKVAMAKNSIVDAAISMGSVFMPVIGEVADIIANVAGWFADLPPIMHGVVTVFGSAAGAVSLVAGGFLLLAPRVMDTVLAFQALKAANLPGVGRGLELLGKYGKSAALAVGAAGLALALAQAGDAGRKFSSDASEVVQRLNEIEAAGSGDLIQGFTGIDEMLHELNGGMSVIGKITNGLGDLASGIGSVFGVDARDGLSKFAHELEAVDAAMSKMSVEDASEAFLTLASQTDGSISSLSNLLDLLPGFKSRLVEVADVAGLATGDLELLWELTGGDIDLGTLEMMRPILEAAAGATSELGDESSYAADMAEKLGVSEEAVQGILDAQISSIQDLIDARRNLAGEAMSQLDLERNRWEIMEGLTEAAEHQEVAFDKPVGTFDVTNDAGWQAHQMSEAWTQAMWDEAEQMRTNGKRYEEIQARMEEMRGEYVNQIDGLQGVGDKAGEVADSYGMIPEDIATSVDLDTAAAMDALLVVEDRLVELDGTELKIDGDVTPLDATVAETLGLMPDKYTGMVTIDGNTYPAEITWSEFLEAVNHSDPTANLYADDAEGRAVLNQLMNDVDVAYEEVDIGGDDTIAQGDLFKLLTQVDGSEEDIKIGGNTLPAIKDKDNLLGVVSQSESAIKVNANTSPFYNSVGSILNKTIGTAVINVATRQSGGSIRAGIMAGFQARAEGGYTPPGWTLVGEEGPELVNFTAPSRVYTADETAQVFQAAWSTPMASDYRSARHGAPPTVNVGAPSLEGLTLQGQIKIGDAIVPLMDARIVRADKIKKTVGRRP